MLSRQSKANFYRIASPLMWLNSKLYRLARAPKQGNVRVHLGPGQAKYLEGWINIDANMFTGKCDLWADLRYSLPFRDNSVDAVYSHHVIEHLPDLWAHFRDVRRCLRPGGVYRFGGPNGDSAIQAFARGDGNWFTDFPDARKSIGGRFENFVFCRQEHLTILTESYLREILESLGFDDIRLCVPTKETGHPDLFQECLGLEYESNFDLPHTILLEATKPQR